MKEKIASLLLICLVALSVVYICSSTAFSNLVTKAIDAVPSKPITVTEGPRQDGKLSCPKPVPLGDPIDNPKPH